MHAHLRKPAAQHRLRFFFPPDTPGENGGSGGAGGGAGAPDAAAVAAAAAAATAAAAAAERGFPEGTPLTEMTGEQREAYWKFYARKHEDTVKNLGDLTEVRRKAAEYDVQQAAAATDVDKARKEGEEAGKASVTASHQAELAEYALRGALSGLPEDKRDAVLAAVDYSKFVAENGRPDEAKIKTFVTTLAPTAGATSTGTGGHGGNRPPGTSSSVSSGAERYAERHGVKTKD